jgi:hypothetical protein
MAGNDFNYRGKIRKTGVGKNECIGTDKQGDFLRIRSGKGDCDE